MSALAAASDAEKDPREASGCPSVRDAGHYGKHRLLWLSYEHKLSRHPPPEAGDRLRHGQRACHLARDRWRPPPPSGLYPI